MAKERDKGSARMRWIRKPIQKLLDDYTGGSVYSNNVERDYRGFIVQKGLADQQLPPDLPTQMPGAGLKPWIVRKEGDPQYVADVTDPTWDTYDEYWNTSDYKWGE